jgi:hypothetical protein
VATRGGTASLVLGAWAAAVFAVLWLGAIAGLASDGELFEQAWAWIGSLGPVGAVVAWILFLPACIGLWATQSGLPPAVLALVVALLAAWTAVAWGGLARRVLGRRP